MDYCSRVHAMLTVSNQGTAPAENLGSNWHINAHAFRFCSLSGSRQECTFAAAFLPLLLTLPKEDLIVITHL